MTTYYGDGLNPNMVGRKLASVASLDGDTVLEVRFDDGSVSRYRVEGDCCSRSWIEHLTVPPDVAGATILRVTDSEGVDATPEQVAESNARPENREYGVDSLLVYQSAIETTRGAVVIEYRNDSNGYYGGYLKEVRP